MLAQGSTWQSAATIGLDGSVTGALSESSGEHWYKFIVSEDGKSDLTVTPSGKLNVWDVTLYTYNEDQTDIVQRNIKGVGTAVSTMTTTDLAPGTYFVRVRRYGESGSYTLTSKYTSNPFANDDKHDDWTTAKALGNGQTVQGHLGYCYFKNTNEEDWYYINVNADGKADITINPDQTFNLNVWDLTLYTYNEDQTDIVQRNIKGIGTAAGTMTTTDLAPGVYFLRVRRYGGHGGYSLNYQLTPNPFANDGKHDDWTTAKALGDGQTVQGHLGYHYFNDKNEEDWYYINVNADGQADITINPDQTFELSVWDLTLYTYNEDQTDIVQRNIKGIGSEPGTITTTDLAPGIYFLRVRRYGGHGGYTLSYQLTPNPFANDGKHDDWTTAKALEDGKTAQGHLGYVYFNDKNEEDWYCYEVTADGKLDITINPSQTFGLNVWDLTLYTYNGDQTDIVQRDIKGIGTELGTMTTTNLAPGIYFLRVRRYGGHGGYTLSCQLTPNPFANDGMHDDWTTAKWLENGKTVQGHLGYCYFKDTNDEDWYCYEVTADGKLDITINPSQTFGLNVWDLTLYTYNGDQTDLVPRNSKGVGTALGTMTTTDVAPGIYFLRVRRYGGHGGYRLKALLTPNGYANDPEANNDWMHAVALEANETVTGHLGYTYFKNTDEVDWYMIQQPAKGTVTLTIHPDQEFGLNVWDITLYGYNSDQTDITQKGISGVGTEDKEFVVNEINAGTYFVRVRRYGGHGAYFLKYGTKLDKVEPAKPEVPEDIDDIESKEDPQPGDDDTPLPSDGTGTEYVYNPTDQTVTVTDIPDDEQGVIIACGPWDIPVKQVLIPYDIFHKNPPKDVSIGSTTPPTVIGGDFDPDDVGNITLHVPAGYEDEYKNHPEWGKFKEIIGDYDKPQPGPGDVIDEFTLWYTLDIGGTVGYKLSEKPQVRLLGEETTVTSSRGVATFETFKIWKFTLTAGSSDPVGIKETLAPLQPEAQPSINREGGDALVFSGCRPGELVRVYTTGGRLVSQYRIDNDGSLILSLSSWKQGLYIVKAGSANIKIMKK